MEASNKESVYSDDECIYIYSELYDNNVWSLSIVRFTGSGACAHMAYKHCSIHLPAGKENLSYLIKVTIVA